MELETIVIDIFISYNNVRDMKFRTVKSPYSFTPAIIFYAELIAIDNGPKEQTEFLKTQKIDKHIINKINKGPGYSKNQAIKYATGDFVAYIDNDLTFEKDGIGVVIDSMSMQYMNEAEIDSLTRVIAEGMRAHAAMIDAQGMEPDRG